MRRLRNRGSTYADGYSLVGYIASIWLEVLIKRKLIPNELMTSYNTLYESSIPCLRSNVIPVSV